MGRGALVVLVTAWTAADLARIAFDLDSIWAEDGAVFLQAARDRPLDLLAPYNGYVHVVPRVLAVVAAAVPLEHAAATLAVLGALGTASCALVVYLASAAHLPNPVLRGALASYLVVMPVAGVELGPSIAYLLWPLLAAAAWQLLAAPSRLGAVVAGLAALSAPPAAILVPVALRQAVVHGGRAWTTAGALLAGLAVQAGVSLAVMDPRELGVSLEWPVIFLQRVVGGLLLGDAHNTEAWSTQPAGYLLVLGSALLLAAWALAAWLRRDPHHALPAAALVGLAVLAFVFCLLARDGSLAPAAWRFGAAAPHGARYFFLPVFLLASAAALGLSRLQQLGHELARPAAAGAALIVLVACSTSFLTPLESRDTSWSAELEHGAQACLAGLDDVVVQTAPSWSSQWTVRVPCRDLEAT
ncbi:MAG: hypothetical protein ACYC2H_10140 [Thermoplasmatota archaeon]